MATLAGTAIASSARSAEPALSLAPTEEAPLDPQRPIVDAHHHLWDHPDAPADYALQRFMLPEFLAIIKASGHNFTHTVFAQCHAMYRADGPEELRPIGETEFVNGIAAMSASGVYGPCRVAAGIVGSADFMLGDRVKPVLEAQIAAGNGRFRGIRVATAYAGTGLFGQAASAANKGVLQDTAFRKAVAALAPLGLNWDISCFHPQLGEVAEVAGVFARTTIVLNHVGLPLNVGPYADKQKEVFAVWKRGIAELAKRPNVVVKLGGLGMEWSVPMLSRRKQMPSTVLAEEWKPYIETCIAAFGPARCMFESNFPPDFATCTYGALWNAFKLIVAAYSEAEKTALFSGTAQKVYRLT
jgi:predicted TIM-barrel fold metal-dependent hydrolase